MKIKIAMKINSEKKHSVRYDAAEIDPAITSVYIMKSALPEKIPQTVIIELEIGE